ncbi:flavin monoamine oxidase family protein [Roseobacteraceae bacterium S113]
MTTLIIGGGLSGLVLAEQLEARGQPYHLVEARSRLGGRILTEHHDGARFDMGPAWFWPGQPRIAALITRLGLEKFDQYAHGALTFEDAKGQVQRGQGFSSMEGSWRLVGGLTALIEAVAARLPDAKLQINSAVTEISQEGEHCRATLSTGESIAAERIVLALPPRVASQIAFSPALPPKALEAMKQVPTWMAGQAKALAVYDTPFWRDAGLSGDAMSRHGPMVEIHDASPSHGGPYGLFGFIGVPAASRADEAVLREHVLAQLTRLFGTQAGTPQALFIKDWAFDPFTATEADKAPLFAHPSYGLPKAMTDLWHDRLLFAGTEVAPNFGGFIEGALEASENVLEQIALQTAA